MAQTKEIRAALFLQEMDALYEMTLSLKTAGVSDTNINTAIGTIVGNLNSNSGISSSETDALEILKALKSATSATVQSALVNSETWRTIRVDESKLKTAIQALEQTQVRIFVTICYQMFSVKLGVQYNFLKAR